VPLDRRALRTASSATDNPLAPFWTQQYAD
jgi:hypothetical protein